MAVPTSFSNSSLSEEASASSGTTRVQDFNNVNPIFPLHQELEKPKRKRNLPGNPDPNAEVIALSPKTLLATNRFICEICNKGFQRDQNLQLHRRGHNLPWKLNKRTNKEIRKKVYVCPEITCAHHNPSRALGDLTGIKKHFCRKHGEKKWRCEKCSKKYAVQSDYKAHLKTCGTREYKCDCGTLFSRKDSFVTHRAFCEALAEESARMSVNPLELLRAPNSSALSESFNQTPQNPISSFLSFSSTHHQNINQFPNLITSWDPPHHHQSQSNTIQIKPEISTINNNPPFFQEQPPPPPQQNQLSFLQSTPTSAHLSATAILQQATNVGAGTISGSVVKTQSVGHMGSSMTQFDMNDLDLVTHVGVDNNNNNGISNDDYMGFPSENLPTWQNTERLTRDFLGVAGENGNDQGVKEMMSFTGAVDFPTYDREMLRAPGFAFGDSWG